MQRVLITGANKGIGLALVQKVLERSPATFVFLGSRDRGRGEAAKSALLRTDGSWDSRIAVLEIDVDSDASVSAAAETLREGYVTAANPTPLYALVNNAGVMGAERGIQDTLNTNLYGVRRVCDAFLPFVDPAAGRLVMTSSASGPMFVASCTAEKKRVLTNPEISWEEIEAIARECEAVDGKPEQAAAMGYGNATKPLSAYGLSKALLNCYTMLLAVQFPHLLINAMSPGWIETDMTKHFLQGTGKTGREIGMKSPAEGTVAAMHLLFSDDIQGNGWYYGSDGVRSPLHRYRSPGDPPYTGDEDVAQ